MEISKEFIIKLKQVATENTRHRKLHQVPVWTKLKMQIMSKRKRRLPNLNSMPF